MEYRVDMKKQPYIIVAVLIFLCTVLAAGPTHAVDPSIITAEIAQFIEISAEDFNYGKKIDGVFTVTSNGGFDISFSGDSPEDDYGTNGTYGYPVFTKQDVDASGITITNQYDHLTTTFGIEITNATTTPPTWGGGNNAAGSPAELVLAYSETNSPHQTIGSIEPEGAGGAKVHLWAKGQAWYGSQSGDYTATVTLTIRASQ